MAVSIWARIAALRDAGYRGPVDQLGYADSGDRAADMARNYWAGRTARQEEEQPVSEVQRLRDEQVRINWNQGGALDRYHEIGRQIGAALQAEAGAPGQGAASGRALGDHCGACFDADCDGGHQFQDPQQRDQADLEAGS